MEYIERYKCLNLEYISTKNDIKRLIWKLLPFRSGLYWQFQWIYLELIYFLVWNVHARQCKKLETTSWGNGFSTWTFGLALTQYIILYIPLGERFPTKTMNSCSRIRILITDHLISNIVTHLRQNKLNIKWFRSTPGRTLHHKTY
jgi:hypothetical protein